MEKKKCEKCNGTGKPICEECKGTGEIEEKPKTGRVGTEPFVEFW